MRRGGARNRVARLRGRRRGYGFECGVVLDSKGWFLLCGSADINAASNYMGFMLVLFREFPVALNDLKSPPSKPRAQVHGNTQPLRCAPRYISHITRLLTT